MRTPRLLALVLPIVLVPGVVGLAASSASAAGAPTTSAAAVAAAAATPAAAPGPRQMPSAVPSNNTPWVDDKSVQKIVQVGNTMIAGGAFTTVQDPKGGATYTRKFLFAFDATTGMVSQTFNPILDGEVEAVIPGPLPNTVFVGGFFSHVNGANTSHIALLDVNTGLAVPGFKAASTNGSVQSLALLGNRLFVGGYFTSLTVNAVPHVGIATLNATNGNLDPYMNIQFAGRHNPTANDPGSTGGREMDINAQGDRLVVVGNFKTADGLPRDQAVMITLGPTSASVTPDWATNGYNGQCSNSYDSYMRGVEFSPDGTWFVITATGGPYGSTLCDTATRFETYASNATEVGYTWTTKTGGDTLWAVGITNAAVYIGGHNRWMNNPNGSDKAQQGAVPRPGLSALDPLTGIPLKWNPGRNPRGEAMYAAYPTDSGLWITSNTEYIGDFKYHRPRIAFFPYDSNGYTIAPTNTGTLPGYLYIGDSIKNSNVLYRVDAGGAAIPALDNGPDWAADTSTSPSTFHNTGSNTQSFSAITSVTASVPSTTPTSLFSTWRIDPTGGNEMQWNFPVAAGTLAEVRLYFAERVTTSRRFNVAIDGVSKLSSYSISSDAGASNRGTMRSFPITSDGSVDISFTHSVSDPVISGIEIVNLSQSPGNSSSVRQLVFDGTNVTTDNTVLTPGSDWSTARGAFMVGNDVYYAGSDSFIHKRSFDGSTFGADIKFDPYKDPAWLGVGTGSGTSVYDGAYPTLYGQLPTLGGITYNSSNQRIYYTIKGTNTLFWANFLPDSGITKPIYNSLTGGFDWSTARGMFVVGNDLYVVSSVDGSLNKVTLVNGAPSGTSVVVNSKATGGIDWRGRALFLSTNAPNVPPTASFTSNCVALTCSFDASASIDPDGGTIASYAWDFGDDGTTGSGVNSSHLYSTAGAKTVTLTVTDDKGAQTTTSQVVNPNSPPTASFSQNCTAHDCTFDANGSSDDGSIASYVWDFGDGGTDNTITPAHHYADPGTYTVTLTVTDDKGDTGTQTKQLAINDANVPSEVAYVASASGQGSGKAATVTVPAGVSVGDTLVLAMSVPQTTQLPPDPTVVTGWTKLGSNTSGTMSTTIWTKTVQAGDAAKKVTVTMDVSQKWIMALGDYKGVDSVTFDKAAETTSTTDHTTPTVTVGGGAMVVSYWADKSALTTGFTLPGSVTSRATACGSAAAHVCGVLADSGSTVPGGPYVGRTATADTASAMATMWSIVLNQPVGGPPNHPPTAAFAPSCTWLDCTFDTTGTGDDDGTISTYSWDFGGDGTDNTASPSHSFTNPGTYTVTYTVTDDDGVSATATHQVTVHSAPVASPIAFQAGASSQGNSTVATATVPAAATAGDTLVLAMSVNQSTSLPADPTVVTGWTKADSNTSGTMSTTIWTKTVQAGDGGKKATVTLPATAKWTMALAEYAGVSSVSATKAAETTNTAAHQTPSINAGAGAWVVSYWADKSGATTSFTLPGGLTSRATPCGSGTGHICAALADSGGTVPGGSYDPLTATADTSSAVATMWSILLTP